MKIESIITKLLNESEYKAISGLILIALIFLAFASRLWMIDTPLADFHSWRQADTAAVARNFQKDGINLLKPRYDDVSRMQSGRLNPQGLRMVEFPIYNAMISVLSQLLRLPIHVAGRLLTAFSSLILLFIIYKLLEKHISITAAIFGGLFFAIQPFIVSYSRVILPDMFAITSIVLAIYIWDISNEVEKTRLGSKNISVVIFSALALLVKPTVIFFLLPIFITYLSKEMKNKKAILAMLLQLTLILLPLILWRNWISQFPEGIPASQWLFTSISTGSEMVNIFFRPAFFRWIFYERILVMIMGGFSFVFVFLGIFGILKKRGVLFWMCVSSLLYLFVFQGGNVQHDYYQILVFPALTITFGAGVDWFINSDISQSKILKLISIIVLMTAGTLISWQTSKFHYDVNMGLVNAGKNIDRVTEKSALIATDTAGDTTLLYLSDRKGFPIFDDVDIMWEAGVRYLATFRTDSKEILGKKYQKIFDDRDLAIFKLEKIDFQNKSFKVSTSIIF